MRSFELKMAKIQKIPPLMVLTTLSRPHSRLDSGHPGTHPLDSIDVSTLLGAFCPGTKNIKSAPMSSPSLCRTWKTL